MLTMLRQYYIAWCHTDIALIYLDSCAGWLRINMSDGLFGSAPNTDDQPKARMNRRRYVFILPSSLPRGGFSKMQQRKATTLYKLKTCTHDRKRLFTSKKNLRKA